MNIKLERIRMAEKLGRPLKLKEKVFHLSGDKNDNRPENLVLVEDVPQMAIQYYNRAISAENSVKCLEREIKGLRENPLIVYITKDEKNDEKTKEKTEDNIIDWVRVSKSITGL